MRFRLFLLAVLLIVVGIAGCGRPQQTAQPKKVGAKLPTVHSNVDAKLQKAGIIWSDEKGRPLWQAHVSEASVFQTAAKSVSKLHDVKADLYKDGNAATILTAPWVEADTRTREVKAYGGVKITSIENGTTVTCQQMVWKSKENKVYGSGKVKMIRQNMTVVASSFVSNTALKNVKFKDAKMSFR